MTAPLEFPLTLRKTSEDACEAPAAWHFGFGDVRLWVEAATRWGAPPQSFLRFVPIPASRSDPGATGAIVFCESGPLPASVGPQRGFGLRLVAGKVLVPFGSALRFPVSKEEARRLFSHDFLVVLPGERMFSFNREDGLALHELISPFDPAPVAWNLARAADDPLPGFQAIGIARLPDFDDVMQAGRDDIGGTDPDKLPQSAGEAGTGGGMKDFLTLPGKAMLNAIRGMARLAPGGAKNPTWIDRVDAWASQKLEEMAGQQGRELDRLIDLLRRDPDKGLAFALPLSGAGGGGRGIAEPGSRLGRRNVSFNLSSLFGSGGSIAPWMVPDDRFSQLQRAYREAANREMNLKRYRRAAYIFGQLLNDLPAAANALEQGGFHHEAAVIYERKLNSPNQAARAYRNGGLFEDALRIYRELGKHEESARLLREMAREEEARECFEAAVEHHGLRDEPVEAARIVRSALDDEVRALGIYREAWPQSKAAAECLELEFHLLAQRGEHDGALARIEQLIEIPLSGTLPRTLVGQFVRIRKDYPANEVAMAAADAARRYVGTRILSETHVDPPLLDYIGQLDPDDRVLGRDARRFAGKKLNLPKPVLASPGPPAGGAVSVRKVAERSQFPDGSVAIAAIGFDLGLFTAKVTPQRHLYLSYNPAEGLVSSEHWPIPPRRADHPPFESPRFFSVRSLYTANDRAVVMTEPHTEACRIHGPVPEPRVALGSHPFFGADVLGATATESGQVWKLRLLPDGATILESSFKCQVGATHAIELQEHPLECAGMVSALSQIFFCMGPYLYRWYRGSIGVIRFPSRITGISLSRSLDRAPVAIGLKRGGAVAFTGEDWGKYEVVNEHELEDVQAGFTRSNHLVLAGRRRLEVYSILEKKPAKQSVFEFPEPIQPLCVAPRREGSQFDIATDRKILTFELNRPS